MKVFLRKLVSFTLISLMILSIFPAPVMHAVYGNGYIGGRAGDGMGVYAHGVDISQWQGGEVDYHKVKAQGYSFVILRAGFSVYRDKYFERNYAAAKEAGLHVGVYLYSYADTVSEVLQEAEALKGWLAGKTLEYPVYYDMEEPDTHGKMSASALTELSMAFLDSMASDGWLVGLYSCKSWLESKLETDKICAEYECWMGLYLPSGSYSTYDRYDEYCGIWQYSSTGSVDGVPGNVDMNVAFKDYPSICMQYGLNGYMANGESLSLRASKEIPRVITTGESIPISGRIFSNDGNLTNVTVGVYDSMGVQILGRSVGPRTESYDIAELASAVDTATLPEGKYTYRVIATNSKGTRTLCQQEFVISLIGLMATAVTAPADLTEGTTFIPQGELHASTSLKEVCIRINDVDGTQILKAAVQPETNTYALPMLASLLNTQLLSLGEYRYMVTATTQLGTQTVLDQAFHVWVQNDPITLTGIVLQSEYHLSELTTLTGTISSENSVLRDVTVSIINQNQQMPSMSVSANGGMQISLEEMSQKLPLKTLSYGTFLCRIEATNDGGPVVVIEKQFVIRPDGLSLCEFDAPVTLYCGDSFLITGVIASDYSALEMISVAVLDEYGQVMFDESVVINVFVYDLSNLARKLRFSDLQVGIYTLRIRAKNGTTSQILYDSKFNVTDLTDRIYWLDAHASPNGISYASYDEMQFYGTIESKESEMSLVKAEVFSQEGVLMNASQIEPMSNSVDIELFNDMLRLSALAEGKYRLVITAQNASSEFIMLDETFYISECSHNHVRSGVIHEQRCDRTGAICDSRCAACGERTQKGFMLSADAHEWQQSNCKYCGKTKMNTYGLVETQSYRQMGRYLIAYCEEEQWYALNIWGDTVAIDPPDENGNMSASAELLWTANVKGEKLYFSNPFGQLLHFNSDSVCVANGFTNVLLTTQTSGSYLRFCVEGTERALVFHNGKFKTDDEMSDLLLFELPLRSE